MGRYYLTYKYRVKRLKTGTVQIQVLKGNCSGKKNFFIPSIDRVCGSDVQEKSDFFTWLCKEIQDFEK